MEDLYMGRGRSKCADASQPWLEWACRRNDDHTPTLHRQVWHARIREASGRATRPHHHAVVPVFRGTGSNLLLGALALENV